MNPLGTQCGAARDGASGVDDLSIRCSFRPQARMPPKTFSGQRRPPSRSGVNQANHHNLALCEGTALMSDRERWTIYPLLLLALGAALKDKAMPPKTLEVNELKCNQLQANKAEIQLAKVNLATMATATVNHFQATDCHSQLVQARNLRIVGSDGSLRVLIGEIETSHGGGIQVYGEGEHPILSASSEPSGASGTVQVFTSDGKRRVALSSGDGGGVVSTYTDDNQLLVRVMYDRKHSGVVFTRDQDGQLRLLLGVPFPLSEQAPAPGTAQPDDPTQPAKPTHEPSSEPPTTESSSP